MNNRLMIKETFLKFVNIMENGNVNELREILTDDVILMSSNYGNAQGINDVIKKLKWNGMPVDFARSRIFNFVVQNNENIAKQSAVVTTLVGNNDPDYFHYFHFGGYYLNDFIKIDDRWKISFIRFNLDMEDGNTLFVRGWWHLIDYRYFEGTEYYPIVSEIDAPWRAIENPEPILDEREKILDTFNKLNWGIDHADFELAISSYDIEGGDFSGMTSFMKEQHLIPEWHEVEIRDVIRLLKFKRYKEAIMEHIWKIHALKIDGNRAELTVYRYEPHRLGTTKFNKLNMHYDFFTTVIDYEFTKNDNNSGNDNTWKITKELPRPGRGRAFAEVTYDKEKFYE
jgi:hypothetical protein